MIMIFYVQYKTDKTKGIEKESVDSAKNIVHPLTLDHFVKYFGHFLEQNKSKFTHVSSKF